MIFHIIKCPQCNLAKINTFNLEIVCETCKIENIIHNGNFNIPNLEDVLTQYELDFLYSQEDIY